MKINLIKLTLATGLISTILSIFSSSANAQTLRVTTTTIGSFTQTDSLYYTPDELRTHVFGNLNFSTISIASRSFKLRPKISQGFSLRQKLKAFYILDRFTLR